MTKSWKRRTWIGAAVVLIIVVIALFFNRDRNKSSGPTTIKVTKNTIIDKALAVGTIEPRNEIQVKSKVSGVVRNLFVEIGDYVTVNSPLIEIRPDPTPLERHDPV